MVKDLSINSVLAIVVIQNQQFNPTVLRTIRITGKNFYNLVTVDKVTKLMLFNYICSKHENVIDIIYSPIFE